MLSDGFQYTEKVIGEETCELCMGSKVSLEYYDKDNPEEFLLDTNNPNINIGEREVTCVNCGGLGVTNKYARDMVEYTCPKDDLLIEQLELHEECGRLVCYAGFTGSIDKIQRLAIKKGWTVLRVDGRGWNVTSPDHRVIPQQNALEIYMDGQAFVDKMLFLGQPLAAGEGLTLTASPTAVYYSNDFNGGARMQSMDRIHRMGMDVNKGATIIDFLHLPTDLYVLENLESKRDLQKLTLTGLTNYVNANT
jgi:SNF2 family DNA or RNA helicase